MVAIHPFVIPLPLLHLLYDNRKCFLRLLSELMDRHHHVHDVRLPTAYRRPEPTAEEESCYEYLKRTVSRKVEVGIRPVHVKQGDWVEA